MRRSALIAIFLAGLVATVGQPRRAFACSCGDGPAGITETFTGRVEERVGDRFTFADVNDVAGHTVSLTIAAREYPDPGKKVRWGTSCDLEPPRIGGVYRVTRLKYSDTLSMCSGSYAEIAAPPPGTPQVASQPSRAWLLSTTVPIGLLLLGSAAYLLRQRRR